MDISTFQKATGCSMALAAKWAPHITAATMEFRITSAAQLAAFLAQIGHESMGFQRTREIWGPTPAQVAYEGRKNLGNTVPGDGSRYRGRGLIQITGRANYRAAGTALGIDLIGHPEMLEDADMAAASAAWWWTTHGLNALADAGEFDLITERINGGQNGADDRRNRWARAKAALQVA